VDAGVRAVFALPLLLGAVRLGVLYLCRAQPGMLSDGQLSDAFGLAQIGTSVLLEIQMGAAPGELGPTLDGEWTHRAIVHQATGMLSARFHVPLTDALARMRSVAFAGDRSIYDVAADVVHRRIKVDP
jgi:hypothetical protein